VDRVHKNLIFIYTIAIKKIPLFTIGRKKKERKKKPSSSFLVTLPISSLQGLTTKVTRVVASVGLLGCCCSD